MSGGSPPRFRVSIDGAPAEQLRAFGAAEKAAGRLPGSNAVARETDYRPKYEADERGESREFLPVLRTQLRSGTVGPMPVWFGVDEANRLVYVRQFRFRGDPP